MEHSFLTILKYGIQVIVVILIIYMLYRKKEKKMGWGSLSLLLALIGMSISFEFGNYILGDQLLSFLGLPAWSNVDNTGYHYTFLLSIIFFIPSLIIGYKNPKEFGSNIGKRVSGIYLFLIIVSLLLFIIG